MLGYGLAVLLASAGGTAARPCLTPLGQAPPADLRPLGSLATSQSRASDAGLTAFAQGRSDQGSAPPHIPNAAGLSLQIFPDRVVGVGTKISFRVTTEKTGYLLLVDVDASGRMSQIFPSPEMIVQSPEAAANLIKPGQELLIPNPAAQKLGFEYIMTPPLGTAAIVAILSDRRVQLLDLPDDAQKTRSEAEMIDYLTRWTSALRLPAPGSGKLQPSNWSFDVKQYSIR